MAKILWSKILFEQSVKFFKEIQKAISDKTAQLEKIYHGKSL